MIYASSDNTLVSVYALLSSENNLSMSDGDDSLVGFRPCSQPCGILLVVEVYGTPLYQISRI